jgi:cell division protein FtsZ
METSVLIPPSIYEADTRPNLVGIHRPVLKVIGLGGGGQNAIDRMIELGLEGVEFIAANTDVQALKRSLAPVKVPLGLKSTRGLGAGGNPEVGKTAAEESWRNLLAALHGADMVFLTAGMGGGTGTGAVPVAAKVARSLGAVTIAIVTTPFSFEMGKRMANACEGLNRLRPNTDTLITIPNDRLLYIAPRDLTFEMAFRMADDVLRQAVQGITDLITSPKYINVDFANIRSLMKLGGGALMSSGQGEGENKAVKAIDQALKHPLMESTDLENAAGILVNFTSGEDLALWEVEEAMEYLHKQLGTPAETVMGVAYDERLQNKVEVILVATGLGAKTLEETLSGYSNTPRRKIEPLPPVEDHRLKIRTELPAEVGVLQISNAPDDLDIPAFLRRAR